MCFDDRQAPGQFLGVELESVVVVVGRSDCEADQFRGAQVMRPRHVDLLDEDPTGTGCSICSNQMGLSARASKTVATRSSPRRSLCWTMVPSYLILKAVLIADFHVWVERSSTAPFIA